MSRSRPQATQGSRRNRRPGAPPASAEPGLLEKDAPPGEGLGVTLHLVADRLDVEPGVPPPVGRLVEQGPLDLTVQALALIVVEDRPGLLHQRIDLRVSIAPVVERSGRVEVRVD